MLSSQLLERFSDSSQNISKPKSSTFEIIQSLLFMVAYLTGLGMLGSTYTLEKFNIDSLLADFLIMILVLLTYTVSHHMIAYCCRESSEKFNFAEYLEDQFGKIPAMIYDILMTVHNILLLAYIQYFVAHFMVEGSLTFGQGDKAYYFLAIVNIPLIFISLYSEFKKIRWFCVALLLLWTYVFIGRLVDLSGTCSAEQYWDEFPVASKQGFGTWVIKLIGLQLYFASAFQSVPFIYKEAKKKKIMSKVINFSSIIAIVVYLTVYFFYTLDPASKKNEEENKSCKQGLKYLRISDYGRVLAGACAIIINVIPARFSLAQFLAGNDAETMKKVSSSDRLLSALLIFISIVMSLFMFNKTFWQVTVCTGVALSTLLGVLVPVLAVMHSEEYRKVIGIKEKPETEKRRKKTKHDFISLSKQNKKVFIFLYLAWSCVFSILGIVSAFFIMTDP